MIETLLAIDQGILEKTLEFAFGEWLLSSYIATRIENVPIFIKADNAEKEIMKRAYRPLMNTESSISESDMTESAYGQYARNLRG
jgi:hypothetical protein